MTSQSFFDRFTSSRRSSILPMHSPPQRLPSEYDLDELEPRPDDRLLSYTPPRERFQSQHQWKGARGPPSEPWDERASSVGSSSKLKTRPSGAMFAGPPPPIASSVVLKKSSRNQDRAQLLESESAQPSGHTNTGASILFDRRTEYMQQRSDSIWRALRRQEKALEHDVQHLLDLQANGLIAGLGGQQPTGSDLDEQSDAGSSTPTGTFYSTATSKSRMINSLHIPARANADGNVIPVRQPKKTRPPGLGAARSGLRKSMLHLANLKAEEEAYIDDALAQRQDALSQLDRLSSRRDEVNKELHTLEDDEEEPLGLALRDLGAQYDSMTNEIHALEEKLVGMRNRRRVIRAQMDDVRNRREAGLSGFRGALRDVENNVGAMMRRPPIRPLDPEIFDRVNLAEDDEDEHVDVSVGFDFLKMLPERRTLEMARAWWQAEIAALERRKAQIDSEHRALEDGGVLWLEVMALVTDFESRLRTAMKASSGYSSPIPATASSDKGKKKVPTQEEVIREQLPRLEKSIGELEVHMQTAESRSWNLLICAIGAELEAFREAHELLRGAVEDEEMEEPIGSNDHGASSQRLASTPSDAVPEAHADDSDENEVPDDLLISAVENGKKEAQASNQDEVVAAGKDSVLRRVDSSDNDVPAEFFAEHDKLD